MIFSASAVFRIRIVEYLEVQHRHGLWIAILLTFWVCGCGGPDGIGRVTGTVTLDGQPLKNAIITFQPQQGRPSTTRSDSQGKYTMEYTVRDKGALIGKHTVYIRTEMEATPDTPATRERLPNKYHNKSELTAEVKAGSNVINFELFTK